MKKFILHVFFFCVKKLVSSAGNKAGISIWGTIRVLREQRLGMVQTFEQYSYIYKFMTRAVLRALKG